MSCCEKKQKPAGIGVKDSCCTATTGCSFNGNLRNVKAEPIYTQKVYDATIFNLQGLATATDQTFEGTIPKGHTITRVLDIRCRKYFDPCDIKNPDNLKVVPKTTLSGAQFVKYGGKDVTVVGPDGCESEKLIYVDTKECDAKCKGTTIFGTQNLYISGSVVIEIDVIASSGCGRECKITLCKNVDITRPSPHCGSSGKHGSHNPLVLTNFFELCVPSVNDGAFLPRFTELCNVHCESRLATNNISRDLTINSDRTVDVDLMISICVTCEKKIIVPVQLCVLSTGFPQIAPEVASACESFPSLFPNQIDRDSVRDCLRERESESNEGCRHPSRDVRGFSEDVEDSDDFSFDDED